MYVVCKQAKKSNLKKQLYRKRVNILLKVAYQMGCRNIRKVNKVEVYVSVSIKSITQNNKSMNTKTFYLH